MNKLDQIAVHIELALISLVQGVALLVLAQQAVIALNDPEWYSYITYILAGLTMLLVFWTRSITRAISFIHWSLQLEHVFMYFVCALIQMIAYTNMTSLHSWFLWWGVFSLMVMAMYVIDLWILRDSHKKFTQFADGGKFLEVVEKGHVFEMRYLIPAAFLLNVVIWLVAIVVPHAFDDPWIYAIPGLLQFALAAFTLYDFTNNFRVRSEMVAALHANPSQK